MTDRDALQAAIRATPDDDLPRLVYADWLDENGGADRAAFVRAQVEAARAEPFSPAARGAEARAAGLLTPARREQWTWHLRGAGVEGQFVRGFVGHVGVEAERLAEVADAVFAPEPVQALRLGHAAHPPVQGFEPDPVRELHEAVFAVPHLRHLTRLELAPNLLTNSLEYDALAGSPHLEGLRDLSLSANPVPPPWLTRFLAGGRLPNLAALDLADIANLGPALAAGLRKADHRRFTRLDLSGVAFRSDALKVVLESKCLSEVEDLRLRWDGADTGPLTQLDLGWVLPWDRLRVLDLGGQAIGLEGVREIARNPTAATLRWLGLARNGLGAEGADLLASAAHLRLYHLDVRKNGLGPRDVQALRRRFPDAVVEA